jgi:hypothetical protein
VSKPAPDLAAALGRTLEYGAVTLTQGELLADFTRHCRDELDDVEVVESSASALVARWRQETCRIEVRPDTAGLEHLADSMPAMVIADLDAAGPDLIERFLTEPDLRRSVCVLDLVRLEKLGTVRSSVFVYLEWFLRDAYRVKVLPVATFTQGLIERGIIHLGMG